MLLDALRIGALLVIALAYALFDVLNRRNVPNWFAYLSVVIGAAVVFTYTLTNAEIGILTAVLVGAMGYVLYKAGFLGGGDVFEFAAICLLLPLQPMPYLIDIAQFNLPFVLSVFVATGIAALWAVPLYYLVVLRKKGRARVPERRSLLKGFASFVSYMILFVLLSELTGFSLGALALILLFAVPSMVIMAYEKTINARMIEFVYPNRLEEGDMIATNLMSKGDYAYFRRITKDFGRLATANLIKRIRGVRKKIPVYENAVPLALYIFIGVAISLLVGNLLLYLVS